MKNSIFKTAFLASALFAFSATGFAQILSWQFSLPQELTGREASVKATTVDAGLEDSELTRGANAVAGPGNARGFSGSFPMDATKADARKSGAYYQFTVKAKDGYSVSLTKLNAILRRQEESACTYRWMYSLDGRKFKEIGEEDVTITDLNNNGVKQPAIDLSTYPELQNVKSKTTITFRLYAWGGVSVERSKRAFGFGKSNKAGSKVLWIDGKVTKVE